jgi:hypothetical protein
MQLAVATSKCFLAKILLVLIASLLAIASRSIFASLLTIWLLVEKVASYIYDITSYFK